MVWGEERSAVASDLWGGERPWRRGQSWMANDSANRAHVMKPPHPPEQWGLESWWVGGHVSHWDSAESGEDAEARRLPL